jgi:hypothetical protein
MCSLLLAHSIKQLYDFNDKYLRHYICMVETSIKVSEMLWNTPKHLLRSNVVEWMLLNFSAPKKCIQARNTSFASFYVPKVSEMLWNTPNIILGRM